MAYMTKEKIAEIRKTLKAEFPTYKFSVTNQNHSTACVAIMESDLVLDSDSKKQIEKYGYVHINEFYLDRSFEGETLTVLQKIVDIMNKGNHDRSDSMTDYFDVGWYIDISFGKWNKPYLIK